MIIKKFKSLEKPLLIFLIVLSLLFTLGTFGYRFLRNRISLTVEETPSLIATNFEPVAPPTDNIELPEGITSEGTLSSAVSAAVSAKHSVESYKVKMEELQSDSAYSRGVYSIEGNSASFSYFSFFKDNKWSILYVGKYEEVPCSVLNDANFPATIMPDCFDSDTNSLVSR